MRATEGMSPAQVEAYMGELGARAGLRARDQAGMATEIAERLRKTLEEVGR
jgi:hypothetical protein